MVAAQGGPGGGRSSEVNPAKLKAVIDVTPLYDAAERFLEGKAQYVLDFMRTPNVDDPFWTPCKHGAALDLVSVPLLLRTGWYDTLTVQTLAAYTRARDRGLKVYLTIGPWTHTEACGSSSLPEIFDFLDEHVASQTKNHRPLPVNVFVTGTDEWLPMPSWPPATELRTFYLDGNKGISTEQPAADSPPATFTYDPNSPTPTVGGPRMTRGGSMDDSIYASRSDVLVYTSDPLEQEMQVMGKPTVQLGHSSDVPHADLWIRLSEVAADGASHNLTENWQALDDWTQDNGVLTLQLVDRAHVFKRGTRVRLIVAGGSFPLFARNSGTGVNRTQAKELKPVIHTVQHGGGATKLILPVGAGLSAW